MAEQNRPASGGPQGSSFLNVPFNSQRLQSLPDIRSFYKSEFKERLKEIRAAHGHSASKVFTKIFGGIKKTGDSVQKARISGLEIAEFKKTSQNMSLVSSLEKNPNRHSARIALAANLSQDKQNLTLEQNRSVLMQLALPIGLGNFNGQNASILLSSYRFYQKQLLMQYKKDKNELKSLVVNPSENKDSANAQNLKNVTLGMDLLTPIIKLKQERVNVNAVDLKSLSIKTVQDTIDGTVKLPTGENINSYKEKIARSLFAIVMSLAEIEFIQDELLETINTMRGLNPDSPIPFALEGKIWMFRLQISVIHQRYSPKLKGRVESNLKQSLAAYGKGLKGLSTINHMKDIQTQVLLGHSSACLFAYSLRNVLNIPRPMYMRFLESGKSSLQKSHIKPKDDPSQLFGRYIDAFAEQNVEWII
ncbi:MAG: hypothetical protein HQM13_07710 [SAR324 cluster bacterium]|nr:hypothetical protein [SAR324 cluster bacterium]